MRYLRHALGSIATKMGIVLLAMAGTTGFAILVSISVFEDVGSNLTSLVNDKLPEVWVSTTILAEANTLEAAVLSVNLATTAEDVTTESNVALTALDRLEELVALSASPAIAELPDQLAQVRASIRDMTTASLGQIESAGLLEERVQSLTTLAAGINTAVQRQVDEASNAMKVGSGQALKDIEATLNVLVEHDVRLLQLVSSAQSQINLLAGYSLAITQASDPALLAEFKEAIVARLPGLMATAEDIATFQSEFVDIEVINRAVDLFEKMSTINAFMAVYQRAEIIAEQQSVEAAFAQITARLSDNVSRKALSASKQNESIVKGLLDGPVANNALLLELEIAVEKFLFLTLQVIDAPSSEEIEVRQKELGKLRSGLRLLALKVGKLDVSNAAQIKAELDTLITFGDPKTGIVQEAQRALKARSIAVSATKNVKSIALKLLASSYSAGEAILTNISDDAGKLQAEAKNGGDEMRSIASVSLALLVAAILLTFRWILLPIRRITATTRRLARDDLSEVTGFERSGGEIKSMATALSVFRDSLVDNKKRVKEEAERAERDHRAAEQRAKEEFEARQREDALKQKARDERAAQEERLRTERETSRRKSEEQAKRAADEQMTIVTNLAEGLKSLAGGDLEVQIDTKFSEVYEPLRLDFNQTVVRLREVIAQIAASETSINASSTEIASRTDQLAGRTQRAAETLADTAASLGIMTDQVTATSERAGAALDLVKDARDCSDKGRAVVGDTVAAMSDIEEFSKRVSQITEVIDEIAFQTNLLALNAGVEAARAGSAGRGFAVVATEVRELAQRSSNAAGEINTLITDSTKKVEEGARLVAETRDALEKIDSAVSNLAIEAGEIAEASQDQAKRISEINGSVTELDQLTQKNATMSQETQRANQSMLSESQVLAHAVAGFTFQDQVAASSDEEAA